MRPHLFLFACLCAAFPCLLAAQPTDNADQGPVYSYADLASRICDLDALAVPPQPGEKSGNISSYDRASAYDEAAGLYVNWGANGDGGGCIRKEGEAQVVAELEGPGVIWRIWSAAPKTGHIQIFIDGAEKPAIDRPFQELFDNTKAPFAHSNLARVMARGMNFFIPIPYQKSCKIVAQPEWGKYFQATYTQFPQGTQVPSFTGKFSPADIAALEKAQRTIAQRGQSPAEGKTTQKAVVAFPGEPTVILDEKESGAFSEIRMAPLKGEAVDVERILREVSIAIYWNGEKTPSVWAPLGDFFGSGFGANPYQSLPAGYSNEDGFYARWYMPFAKGARVEIRNDGAQARELAFSITQKPLSADKAAGLLRFHAKWHRNAFGTKEPERYFTDRWPDWPLLLVDNAKGRFCGVSLHIWNPFHLWNKELKKAYVPQLPRTKNPVPDNVKGSLMNSWWWGEGDEKFFVDGEKFPSTFGTGSEDYFGYAWGAPQFFDSHSQNQPRTNDNTGHIVVSRWHIADNVPFQKSFEAAIEKYHDDNWPLLYAATAFWYQQPGTADMYEAQPLSERLDYFAAPQINPEWAKADGKPVNAEPKDPVIVECETVRVFNADKHLTLSSQSMDQWGKDKWSGDKQLLGQSARPTASFEMEIPAPDKRAKALRLYATQAPDYAILSITVNGQPALRPFDGYAPKVTPAGSFALGTFTPVDGKFILKFTVSGANEKAIPNRYYFGLDAVGLRNP